MAPLPGGGGDDDDVPPDVPPADEDSYGADWMRDQDRED
jgi:hypothetical protein